MALVMMVWFNVFGPRFSCLKIASPGLYQLRAYFIVRAYQFLVRIGIDPDRIRFRQHQEKELAHYAFSFGWIECVGISNRGDSDLSSHSKKVVAKSLLHLSSFLIRGSKTNTFEHVLTS